MFLGYQGEIIALVANTREELENNKFMKFDRIEESAVNYELYNGEYLTVTEAAESKDADAKAAQIKALQEQLDTLDLKAIRALRALQAETGTEADRSKLVELETQATDIRAQIQALQG